MKGFCLLPCNCLHMVYMTKQPDAPHTDITQNGWWQALPPSSHRYVYLARLDRPIGWWLLLLPAWWSIPLGATSPAAMVWLMGLFMLGAIITRAAGCVINDMWDRDLDRQVARTINRPLASGAISMRAASYFLAALGLAGLLLLLQLPVLAVYVGCTALPLVVLYPLAKRVIWFPQMVLGLTFSWGILLGWTAAQNSLPALPVLLLYAGAACWVFGYDTIYAVQDMADDRIVGVKSSALALAGRLRLAVGTAYFAAAGLIGAGLWWSGIGPAGAGLVAWGGLAAMATHLGWQVWRLEPHDPGLALRLFKSNRDAGLCLAAGLVMYRLIAS